MARPRPLLSNIRTIAVPLTLERASAILELKGACTVPKMSEVSPSPYVHLLNSDYARRAPLSENASDQGYCSQDSQSGQSEKEEPSHLECHALPSRRAALGSTEPLQFKH